MRKVIASTEELNKRRIDTLLKKSADLRDYIEDLPTGFGDKYGLVDLYSALNDIIYDLAHIEGIKDPYED